MRLYQLIIMMLAIVGIVLALTWEFFDFSSKTCNKNSVASCVGEHVGTECSETPGRGFTCTEVSGGSILRPQCSCDQ